MKPSVKPPVQDEPHGPASSAKQDGRALMTERVQALRLDNDEMLAQKPRSKRWLWLALFAIAVSIALYMYRDVLASKFLASAHEVEAVTVALDSRAEILLNVTGYVIPHSLMKVNSRVPGTVEELSFEEGEQVTEGDVLIQLDDTEFLANLNQAKAALKASQAILEEQSLGAYPEEIKKAEAALRGAEASLEQATKEMERNEKLKDDVGTVSRVEQDRIEAAHIQAEAAVEQAKQALRLLELGPREERIAALRADVEKAEALVAKAQFSYDGVKILAPITGTVIERSVELGDMLRPESPKGSPCTLADLSRLKIEIDIPERDLAKIQIGQPCQITTDVYPDNEYQGHLDWLSPTYDRLRGIRPAKILVLAPDDKLLPGMRCQVQILQKLSATEQADAIFIPLQALVKQGEDSCVYVLDGKIARRRKVRVGNSTDRGVRIDDGLQEGEVILISGEKTLRDGQKVQPRMRVAGSEI